MDKKNIRQKILQLRDAQTALQIQEKSRRIEKRLFSLPEFKKSRVIMFYLSFKSEVKTERMIRRTLRLKKRIFVPVVKKGQKKMFIAELKDYGKELTIGDYGIPCPKEKCLRPVSSEPIDLIVVPGVVFDERGYRLGYGKGFYDKFLAELRKKVTTVGLAFESQVVKKVPDRKHDVRLDKVLTEIRTVSSDKKRRV